MASNVKKKTNQKSIEEIIKDIDKIEDLDALSEETKNYLIEGFTPSDPPEGMKWCKTGYHFVSITDEKGNPNFRRHAKTADGLWPNCKEHHSKNLKEGFKRSYNKRSNCLINEKDFEDFPEVLELLESKAKEEMRPLKNQIMWMLKNIADGTELSTSNKLVSNSEVIEFEIQRNGLKVTNSDFITKMINKGLISNKTYKGEDAGVCYIDLSHELDEGYSIKRA